MEEKNNEIESAKKTTSNVQSLMEKFVGGVQKRANKNPTPNKSRVKARSKLVRTKGVRGRTNVNKTQPKVPAKKGSPGRRKAENNNLMPKKVRRKGRRKLVRTKGVRGRTDVNKTQPKVPAKKGSPGRRKAENNNLMPNKLKGKAESSRVIRSYKRQAVLADGNCGYTAFPITREFAYQLITKNLNNVRDFISSALYEVLLLEKFQVCLKEKGVISKDTSNTYITDNIDSFLQNLNVIQAYVDYDVRDGKVDAGWAHPAILQAIAHIRCLNIGIWQLDANNQLVPHEHMQYAEHKPDGAEKWVNLLFVNGNHFEKIDIKFEEIEADVVLDNSQNQKPGKRGGVARHSKNDKLPPGPKARGSKAKSSKPRVSTGIFNDVLTKQKAIELLKAPLIAKKRPGVVNKNAGITEDEKQLLLERDYTEKEVDKWIQLGLTPLLVRKLVNPELQLSMSESIDLIKTCITMGNPESKSTEALNQDLVLVIGSSGTGKSTAINYLYGCDMGMKKIPGKLLPALVVKEGSEIPEVMPMGHNPRSKTFIPSVIHFKSSGLTFCDCPGFNDNRGFEVNIANAVNIRKMIKNPKSITVLFLVAFKDVTDLKKEKYKELNETLNQLFDGAQGIEANNGSILVGITRPNSDVEHLSMQEILDYMYAGEIALPEQLRENTFILDPREAAQTKHLPRDDWINKIKEVSDNQVVDREKMFTSTVLSIDDKLNLIKISEEISKTISVCFKREDEQDEIDDDFLKKASHSLVQMKSLKSINNDEINGLYDANLEDLVRYTESQETLLRGLINHADCDLDDVGEKLRKYAKIVAFFRDFSDDLEENFLALVENLKAKYIEIFSTDVETAITNLKNFFEENKHKGRLASLLHTLLNIDQEISTVDEKMFGCVSEVLDEMMNDRFGDFATFATQLDLKRGILSRLLAHFGEKPNGINMKDNKCLETLQNMAKVCSEIVVEKAIIALEQKKSVALEELNNLQKTINWQDNGREALTVLSDMKNNMLVELDMLDNLQKKTAWNDMVEVVINTLARLSDIALIPGKLHEIASEAHTTIFTLPNNDELNHWEGHRLICQRLLEIKSTLEVDNFLAEMMHVIKEGDSFDLPLEKLKPFSIAQFLLLKEMDSEKLHLTIIERYRGLLKIIEEELNFEHHGKDFINKLIGYQFVGEKDASYHRLIKLFPVVDINEITVILKLWPVVVALSEKCSLQLRVYASLVNEMLLTVHQTFIAKENRMEEKNKLEDADELIREIHDELLPSNKFELVSERAIELLNIDKNKLNRIILASKVDALKKLFQSTLRSGDYEYAYNNLSKLIEMDKYCSGILQKQGKGDQLNITQLKKEVLEHIESVEKCVQNELKKLFSIKEFANSRNKVERVKETLKFFNAANEFSKIKHIGIKACRQRVVEFCVDHLRTTYDAFKKDGLSLKIFLRLFLQTQKLAGEINMKDRELKEGIDKFALDFINNEHNLSKNFLGEFDGMLTGEVASSRPNEEERTLLRTIINDFPQFSRAKQRLFNELTGCKTTDELIQDLSLSDYVENNLRQCYKDFNDRFTEILNAIDEECKEYKLSVSQENNKNWIHDEKTNDTDVLKTVLARADGLAENLKSSANKSFKKGQRFKPNDLRYLTQIAKLVANVFGVYSYINAHKHMYYGDKKSLWKPHAAQVFSVFLMFGMDHRKGMENHLLEVRTGEGKSVIIAGAAVMFALLGYEIDVTCYNPGLARRDKKKFEILFKKFHVDRMIQYGDFSTIYDARSQQVMGNLRGLAVSFIKSGKLEGNQNAPPPIPKRILLIDEVDVLFNKHYLGTSFTPGGILESKDYRELLQSVWDDRDINKNMSLDAFRKKIRADKRLHLFMAEYSLIKSMMTYFLNQMYYGLCSVANAVHPVKLYEVFKNKDTGKGEIVYRDRHSFAIQFNLFKGHQTAFAIIQEYESDMKAFEYEYNNNLGLSLSCGLISFIELLKSYPYTIGATGTLFSLNALETSIIEACGIKRRTKIPSFFDNKNQISQTEMKTVIVKDTDLTYFDEIMKSVEGYIANNQPALVVFENDHILYAYEKYISQKGGAAYGSRKVNTQKMHSKTPDSMRLALIKEAVKLSQITLMVREFGRGSDFVHHSDAINEKGGVAVICTFFPESIAEEVQILGRTCRFGKNGAYNLIVNLAHLKKFGINGLNENGNFTSLDGVTIQPYESLYAVLNAKRNERQDDQTKEIKASMIKVKGDHKKTKDLGSLLGARSIFHVKNNVASEKNKVSKALEIIESFNGGGKTKTVPNNDNNNK